MHTFDPNEEPILEQLSLVQDCFGLAFLRHVMGPENSCHSLNQSDSKSKPIATLSVAFSRVLGCFVFTSSSHWLLVIVSLLVLALCECSGLGFTTQSKSAQRPIEYLKLSDIGLGFNLPYFALKLALKT